MFTDLDFIRERLIEANDREYYDSLYSQMRYSYGEPWNIASSRNGSSVNGSFPRYDAVSLYKKEVGRSMKIVQNSIITLSKVMGNDPEPESPQVDRYTAEARKQWWLRRWQGYPAGESWRMQFALAFMEGNDLGLGFIEWGLKKNRATGKHYTSCRHSPSIQTIKDPHESDPAKFRLIAFVKYLAPEEAIARWPGKKKEIESGTDYIDSECARKAVRVIEYYDIGLGNTQPTYCVLLDDIDGVPLVSPRANPFDSELPFSYCEHLLLPGMRHHVGRIILQMATQEARNDVERAIRNAALDTGIDIVNTDKVDKAEYQKAIQKDKRFAFAKTGVNPEDMRPAVERIPPKEASATTFNLLNLYDRELNAEGGTTDLEKGSQLTQDRTLGEVQLIDARSQVQGAWSGKQCALMYVRSAEKAFKFAKTYETDPVPIDVFGQNIVLNDPLDSRSSAKELFAEDSEIIVNQASLTASDELRKVQQRIQAVQLLRQYPQTNPDWAYQETAKALGEDPDAIRIDPSQYQTAPSDMASIQNAQPEQSNGLVAGQPA